MRYVVNLLCLNCLHTAIDSLMNNTCVTILVQWGVLLASKLPKVFKKFAELVGQLATEGELI